MVDMSSISAAVGSLKAATDIARGLIDIKTMEAVHGKVIELQETILAAQASALDAKAVQFSLLSKIHDLEKELEQIREWSEEKRRYILKDFGNETYAYELRDDDEHGEPPHKICPNCFQMGNKSVLQFEYRNVSQQDSFNCPRCSNKFTLGTRIRSSSPRRDRGGW